MKTAADGAAAGAAAAAAAATAAATAAAAPKNPVGSGAADATATETAVAPALGLTYSIFTEVAELDAIRALIDQELSEPYSVYTYRYFVYNWPQLCIMCREEDTGALVGIIICKADVHKSGKKRGYIAMLVVDTPSRKRGIGAELVSRALHAMADLGCDEAVLETEHTNKGALRLYANFGFLKDKHLPRYYLNGNDAFRLKLPLNIPPPPPTQQHEHREQQEQPHEAVLAAE